MLSAQHFPTGPYCIPRQLAPVVGPDSLFSIFSPGCIGTLRERGQERVSAARHLPASTSINMHALNTYLLSPVAGVL